MVCWRPPDLRAEAKAVANLPTCSKQTPDVTNPRINLGLAAGLFNSAWTTSKALSTDIAKSEAKREGHQPESQYSPLIPESYTSADTSFLTILAVG